MLGLSDCYGGWLGFFRTENALPAEQQDFVRELEVMKAVKKMGQHINIVNFLGCSTQGGWCVCVCVCVCACTNVV